MTLSIRYRMHRFHVLIKVTVGNSHEDYIVKVYLSVARNGVEENLSKTAFFVLFYASVSSK